MAGLDETEGLCGDLTEIMSRLARHLPAAAQEARS
jgi:hypothetical protein